MWGRVFERAEEVDVEAFATALDRDTDWLYKKMVGPMIQVGMDLVPCFEATTGGGAEEDELSAEGTGPTPTKNEDKEEDEKDTKSYPNHEGFGWYRLSDGSRVQHKALAHAAQETLDAGKPEQTT